MLSRRDLHSLRYRGRTRPPFAEPRPGNRTIFTSVVAVQRIGLDRLKSANNGHCRILAEAESPASGLFIGRSAYVMPHCDMPHSETFPEPGGRERN